MIPPQEKTNIWWYEPPPRRRVIWKTCPFLVSIVSIRPPFTCSSLRIHPPCTLNSKTTEHTRARCILNRPQDRANHAEKPILFTSSPLTRVCIADCHVVVTVKASSNAYCFDKWVPWFPISMTVHLSFVSTNKLSTRRKRRREKFVVVRDIPNADWNTEHAQAMWFVSKNPYAQVRNTISAC